MMLPLKLSNISGSLCLTTVENELINSTSPQKTSCTFDMFVSPGLMAVYAGIVG